MSKKNIEPRRDCFAYSDYGKCKILDVESCSRCNFYKHKSEINLLKIEQDIIKYSYRKNNEDY